MARAGLPRLSRLIPLLLALPASAEAGVTYRERTETFEIGVRDGTPEDIWTAIRRHGPFIGGMHAVGSAAGRIRWPDLAIERRGHDCRLGAHTIDVEVVLTLPEWWRARSSPDDQQAYWRCIERTVTVHERRHAEIWRETADTIDRAFNRFGDWMACDALRDAIGETGNRLFQDGARRQREFDADDRRRRRYEQCAPPVAAESRPLPAGTPPQTAAGHFGARHGGERERAAVASNAAHTARLDGGDSDQRSEDAAEPNPFEALRGAAAAALAILAAAGAYFGLMAGVMAWSRRRPREID